MLTYLTTIWTPYHETICRELEKRLGADFRLVLTEPVDLKRNLGWNLMPPKEDWIVPPPVRLEELASGVWAELILSSDVAVIGALAGHRALFRAVDRRVASGKLTFFMGERPFKRGLHFKDFLRPYNWYVWWRLHRRYDHANVHFLSIGNGVREDLKFLRVRKATIHSWAYFPAVSSAPIDKTPSEFLRICWCGRMIACKHVEVLIEVLALLPPDVRARCRVTIAGDGPMREAWVSLTQTRQLQDVVTFKPMLPHDQMLALMEESDVYVFPSDGEEGWGVALEEAMDKCCVPIACAEAGAPAALIEDDVSGFLIPVDDAPRLAEKLCWLQNHSLERRSLGVSAWRRVQNHSPCVGAETLISLVKEFS